MKVLVIGKGGREHALVHAVSRSGRVKKIYAAPGNPGMAELAECVNIADSDVKGLTAFAKEQEIGNAVTGYRGCVSGRGTKDFRTDKGCGTGGVQQGLCEENHGEVWYSDSKLPDL